MTAGIIVSRYLSGPALQKSFAVMMLGIAGITLYTQLV
jgi:hypothetical protein